MKTAIALHLYTGDNVPDYKGDDRCTVCMRPKRTCPNKLPATPAGVREHEARLLGEADHA